MIPIIILSFYSYSYHNVYEYNMLIERKTLGGILRSVLLYPMSINKVLSDAFCLNIVPTCVR